ncbi:MAG: alpha-tubulin suppressor-like RCC1 family protein [Myxococcota bacterium]|jgi:alpha-tubulin suppressor-like RCC1 family protein
MQYTNGLISMKNIHFGAVLLALATVSLLGSCGDDTSASVADTAAPDDVVVSDCPGELPFNGCGGCAMLSATIGAPGTQCETTDGFAGFSTCDGDDAVVCLPLAANGCGGTDALAGIAGTTCGTCGRGVWTCEGTNTVTCKDSEDGINACGGCRLLQAEPGANCGQCGGQWACADNNESVTCEGDTLNSCGGCGPLQAGEPGGVCNGNGIVACQGNNESVCAPPGKNACGGSTVLTLTPGAPCGACDDGFAVCASPETVACIGATGANACGGCGFLPGQPGGVCAPVGIWACEEEALTCVFTGGNGCGGTAPLKNPANPDQAAELGTACGVCSAGKLACKGFDAVHCLGGDDTHSWAWPDVDKDTFGDSKTTPVVHCELPEGFVRNGLDCDDSLSSANPGPNSVEVCDGVDNDCDGATDEGTSGGPCLADDGCGGVIVCDRQGGPRCDAVPATAELCDGLDNNCDGTIDEANATGCTVVYLDKDVDGFGVDDACLCPGNTPGYAKKGGDCDDERADISPAAFELCNGLDDDCDGTTDVAAANATIWYPDVDEDSFGAKTGGVASCIAPPKTVANHSDCNDGDAAIHPSTADAPVTEICDGIDNDCDGATDPDVSLLTHAFRKDMDKDTFGSGASFKVQCTKPTGYVASVHAVGISAGWDHVAAIGKIGEIAAWGGDTGADQNPLMTGRVGALNAGGSDAVAAGNGFTAALLTQGSVVAYGLTLPESMTSSDADIVALAAGDHHLLALTSGGIVLATGGNDDGQSDIPPGLSNVVAIAAGGQHSLALRADGTVVAFGRSVEGQTDVPAGLTAVQGIAAGGFHSVALRSDGKLVAWGLDDNDQSSVPPTLSNVAQVAAGSDHTLALRTDGTVVAFGGNFAGQANVPNGFTNAVAVAAGRELSVVLRANGSVWAFGRNVEGQASVPVALKLDCNDTKASINPNADDICDFIDNDCDGAVDMADSQGTTPWYADFDSDGHGDAGAFVLGCTPGLFSAAPLDRVLAPTDDCDDANPEAFPGATEIVADSVDQDCDGREWCYIDGDGDGAPKSFTSWALSDEGDLSCEGTSSTSVKLTRGTVVYGTIAQSPLTLGEPGLTDCDDTNPNVTYTGCDPMCIPNCNFKECGFDDCFDTCGTCEAGDVCNPSSQCEPAECVPDCAGKNCGFDGCDGECGLCGGDEECGPADLCEPSCIPDCAGKSCGDDGCFGDCGFCGNAEECTPEGICQTLCF